MSEDWTRTISRIKESVDEFERELRNDVRIEVLRDLAQMARAGITLDADALEELASECEKATASLQEASDLDDLPFGTVCTCVAPYGSIGGDAFPHVPPCPKAKA
jgi:hypothetical protein